MFHYAISQIVWVQNVFQGLESYLSALSIITHPKIMYIYFLPIFAAFNLKFYCTIMLTAIFSDYTNIILKWIIAEARPFWWIHEDGMYTDENRSILRQTDLTCETSSGNPSGHVMHQAAIFYVIAEKLIELINRHMHYDKKNIIYAIWTIYIVFLTVLSVSRMYFACHFFHQCAFGGLIGYFLSKLFNTFRMGKIRNSILNASLKTTLKIGLLMILLGSIIHYTQILIGINPQWSIQSAFKWCHNPYNVNPDTTPVFSLIREIGLAFGMIFSSPLTNRFDTSSMNFKRSFPIIIFLIMLYHTSLLYVPKYHGVLIYFGYTFFIHFLLVFTILRIIPYYCCIRSSPPSANKKNHNRNIDDDDKKSSNNNVKNINISNNIES